MLIPKLDQNQFRCRPNKVIIKNLKDLVLSYWPNRKNDYFPAPQPVSLERRDIFKLKKFKYLACPKSDGMRFLMVCSNITGNNKCYMVDRAFRFYEVDQYFDEGVYTNTIFDGELVQTGEDKKWTYVIHDCVVFKNNNVSQKSFTDRYEYVNTAVETFWSFPDDSTFPIEIKHFFKFNEIKQLVSDMNDSKINHNTDGIIFTPIDLPVGMHTQYTLFKWKPRDLHTFDFKIDERADDIVAQINEKGEITDFASVNKNTEVGKIFYEKLKELKDYKNGSIVECNYNEVTECYEPKLVRTGKTHPNGIFTVDKTLLNIRQNITVQELINISK